MLYFYGININTFVKVRLKIYRLPCIRLIFKTNYSMTSGTCKLDIRMKTIHIDPAAANCLMKLNLNNSNAVFSENRLHLDLALYHHIYFLIIGGLNQTGNVLIIIQLVITRAIWQLNKYTWAWVYVNRETRLFYIHVVLSQTFKAVPFLCQYF